MALSSFENLPSLVHDIILQQILDLSPSSLRSFYQVSKKCNHLAEPFVYRSITLTEETNIWGRDPAWDLSQEFFRRILDPREGMRNYIREIVIENWREDDHEDKSEGFETVVLEQILRTVSNLRSFSWNAPTPVPRSVLLTINTTWPTARLKVCNLKRANSLSSTDMPDLDLLLSPQLHTLEYAVLCESFMAISEFPMLRQILSKSKNLRVLHLEIASSWDYDWNNLRRILQDYGLGGGLEGHTNLQLTKGSYFPPLEELKLCTQYNLSRSHCVAWRKCMDWNKLRTLDLGDKCPQTFFTELRGSLPHLISLKFMYELGLTSRHYVHHEEDAGHRCRTVSEVGQFLDDIKGLEELYIKNHGEVFFKQLWFYIIRHLPTIRVLEVYTTPFTFDSHHAWDQGDLLVLWASAPRLEVLSIDLKLETKGEGAFDWPRQAFRTLARFSRLSSLALHFNLSREQISRNQPIGESHVLDAATQLSRAFYKNDTKSRLESLVLVVGRVKCKVSVPTNRDFVEKKNWEVKHEISKMELAFDFDVSEDLRFGGPSYDDMYRRAGY